MWWDRIKGWPAIIRLLNWEYWPAYAFYWPLVLFYYPYLSLKAGHWCFFTAANPGIETGGLGAEPKIDTIRKIPGPYRPKSTLILAGTPFREVRRRLFATGIEYPLIAKPNVGFRGILVKKIGSEDQLEAYLDTHPVDFILQEFIDLPSEIGVLYYRFPEEEEGTITSLTLKEFLSIQGDGQSTVLELIERKARARLQLDRFRRDRPHLLDKVPEEGVELSLGSIGNHNLGTRFIDANHLIDDRLRRIFDGLFLQLEGVCYGRLDIKCRDLEDLKAGGHFVILEINGVCSEPTHMYDPRRNTYFGALREILRHWSVIYRLSMENHRRGAGFMPAREMLGRLYRLWRYLGIGNW
ncbi:MAG: hypothetical protein R3350_06270 [Saprospiraceae bacterium]|nr:hypothetical protein [Saprospiraceae bacterium]